jgi:mono/diheme cytochrome c family protein
VKLFAAFGLLAFFGALMLPEAHSDCRRVIVGGQTYAAPVYAAPIYHQAHENIVLVPKAFLVQTRSDYAAGIGDEIRQKQFAKDVADELYRMIQEAQRYQAPPQTGGQTRPPVDVTPNPAQPLKAEGVTIKDVLAKNCVSCHGKGGNLPLLTGDPDKIDYLIRGDILNAVVEGRMPKNKPALTQEELNVVHAWQDRRKAKK